MNLILLGAPGSGKGTQADLISNSYFIPAISTGEIIRENIKNKTELGILSEKLINNGQLVPDELVVNLVKDRLTNKDVKGGYILDGFPRTVEQAKALEKISKVDKVIYIDVDYEIIEDRILSRKVCPICKKTYNSKTHDKDYCTSCNAKLVVRDDDNKETVKKRFEVYQKQTQPLVDFYKAKHLLYTVKGNKSTQYVFNQIKMILQNEGHYDL